jgi:hypothetical protein
MGGGYLVAGTTWQNDNDFFLLKVDETGVVSTNQISVQRKNLTVYPNPSNGNFEFYLPEQSSSNQVNMYDMTGKKVYSQYVSGYLDKISLQLSLEAGAYLLKLDGNKSTYKALIILK